ncbi:phytanoyl-CoA dioxygenase family protein [Haloarcula nitratireducens]|uniref:phytanoyl-CoA dioxygenase family protein n=1 Tax=Haloarcula nitratireducens TaxID=2487749 RepID=UPI001F1B76C2|nr:phytanoyl-CoA dioxygenase family protein [Halomicroarcula nitratireducens]
MTLTEGEFEQYQRDGYVVVDDCLDDGTVERVTARIDEYVRNERRENGFQRMLEPGATPVSAASKAPSRSGSSRDWGWFGRTTSSPTSLPTTRSSTPFGSCRGRTSNSCAAPRC